MMNTIEEFLKKHHNVDPDQLSLWLVSKSISFIDVSVPDTLAVRTVPASIKIILIK